MSKTQTIIFSDGASRGNPGPGGWGAIVATDDQVTELGGHEAHTTNNRMELTAVAKALQAIPKHIDTVHVYTDSTYVMQGATQWIHGWRKNGWQTKAGGAVSNRDLWESLADAMQGKKIEWHVVKGHVGVPGNERVDVIATQYADTGTATLYTGTRDAYTVDVAKTVGEAVAQTNKDRSKQKAYSYLSLVENQAIRHKTWAACEQRVKGVAGAKYRKSVSLDDELDILRAWGITSDTVTDEEE